MGGLWSKLNTRTMKIFLFPTGGITFCTKVGDVLLWGNNPSQSPIRVVINEDGSVQDPREIEGLCTILNTLGLITMGRSEPVQPIHTVANVPQLTTVSKQNILNLLGLHHLSDADLSRIPKETLQLALTMRARLLRVGRRQGGYPPWAFHIDKIVHLLKE